MVSAKAYLSLFKEQLVNQVPEMRKKYGFQTDGEAFGFWFLHKAMGYSEADADDVLCDGGGDLGIDAVVVSEHEVVFYQFKNPQKIDAGVGAGEVDKLISGLTVIIGGEYEKIANPDLKEKVAEIRELVPSKYVIRIVATSTAPMVPEAKQKLDSFCRANIRGFSWEYLDIEEIHHRFYSSELPTLDRNVKLPLSEAPYVIETSGHQALLFVIPGEKIASLYEEHGEELLQQNIRLFHGDTATNLAIQETASKDPGKFFFYNNGLSLIADRTIYNPFSKTIELERPQIVNGGQTIRILSKLKSEGKLSKDVLVAVRISTTLEDKEFGTNVAVNLNSHTKVDPAFLRSNNPVILQLYHSTLSKGWYLERRKGDAAVLKPNEKKEIEAVIGAKLDERIIPLKEGLQAFVATVYGKPGVAKKDPALIFQDTDGGEFSKIISSGLTAEQFICAHRILQGVENFVGKFKIVKRKHYEDDKDKLEAYKLILSADLVSFGSEDLDQIIPQSAVFCAGWLYHKFVTIGHGSIGSLADEIESDQGHLMISDLLVELLRDKKALKGNKAWPTLMKAPSFYQKVLDQRSKDWKT